MLCSSRGAEVLQRAQRQRGHQEEREAQPHAGRRQKCERACLPRRLAHARSRARVHAPAHAADRAARSAWPARRWPPCPAANPATCQFDNARDAGHEYRRSRPSQIAGQTVYREGVAQSLGRHAPIENGEVHGMEYAVAEPGKRRRQCEHRIVARSASVKPGDRETTSTPNISTRLGPKRSTAKPAAACPTPGDDEEDRHQRADLGEAQVRNRASATGTAAAAADGRNARCRGRTRPARSRARPGGRRRS